MLLSQLTAITDTVLWAVLDLVASSQNHAGPHPQGSQAEASFCAFS